MMLHANATFSDVRCSNPADLLPAIIIFLTHGAYVFHVFSEEQGELLVKGIRLAHTFYCGGSVCQYEELLSKD